MAETLIIRLPALEDESVEWMLIDETGQPSGPVRTGALAQAAPEAPGRRLVVLVPGTEVLLAEPQLPARGARIAQILPFALEEQLADDVEELHFAVGRRKDQPGTPAAVVARERMEEWLERLRSAQLEPQAIYADCALLPENPSHSVLLIEQDRLHVRHPGQPPFVLQVQPLATALQVAGLEENAAQRHLIVYLGEQDWQRHQGLLEAARERFATLNVQVVSDGALSLLVQQLEGTGAVNLRQGAYAFRSQFKENWQRWRLAAMLLVGLIALNLIGTGVQLWRLNQTEKALDTAIEQTFRAAMPGEQNTANARRRMEARLAAARGGGTNGADMFTMLGAVGRAFSQVPDARLQSLSYRNSVLDLRVAARDVGSLSRLETLIGQSGLSAQLQSSTAGGNGVEGRVQIRAAGGAP